MFTQSKLNYQELIQVSVPNLDEEVFNKTMKEVIHEYMYAEPCDNGIADARFFWWNQKFVQTKMSYFDKGICSFQLHIINTCLGVDTLIYYNYDRKAERFISSMQLLDKLKRQLNKQKKYENFTENYLKELSFVIRKDGLEIYKEYDLIKGAERILISWDKLGELNIKKLLKSID